jgi:hypothetical protein
MSLATILIPVGIVGLFVASEYRMASRSKWDVLSQRFPNTSMPPNGWCGCRFLQMESVEGNRLTRVTYRHGYSKSALDAVWDNLFPKASVSAGPAGLYLKRQPWNFRHPQILIPWSRFNSIQTISGTQHVTETAGRQRGFAGEQFRVNLPKAVAGVIDKLAGDVVELRLSDPNLRIDLPANAAGNLEQYVGAKTKAPVRQPTSLVGVV